MTVVCKYVLTIRQVGEVHVLKLIVLDVQLNLDVYEEVDFGFDLNSQEDWTHKVVVDPIFSNIWLFAFRRLLGTLRQFLLSLLPYQCLELLVSHGLVVWSSVGLVRNRQVEQSRWVAEHPLTVNFNQANRHAFVFLNKDDSLFANLSADDNLRRPVLNHVFVFPSHPSVAKTNKLILWLGIKCCLLLFLVLLADILELFQQLLGLDQHGHPIFVIVRVA